MTTTHITKQSQSDDTQLYYRTTDLGVAAMLMVKNYELAGISREFGKTKATFSFQRDAQLDDLIEDYWTDEVTVSPLQFAVALKHLKSRIYNL